MIQISNTNTLSKKHKIVIHCQYVYGIGHLVRTCQLALALCDVFDVTVINGGEKVPNYELPENVTWIQLPAIYKKETSQDLIPVDTLTTLDVCFARRNSIINDVLNDVRPDLIITEHFPFGLLFEKEVINLISDAKSINENCKIVSSVRDILDSEIKDSKVFEILERYFDHVLIHSDKEMVPFQDQSNLRVPISYTGYIVQNIKYEKRTSSTRPLIMASIGGGRLGQELLTSLINEHQKLFQEIPHDLEIFKGAFQGEWQFDSKYDHISSLKISEFNQKNYQLSLAKASLIICMGGYNSLLEAVISKIPVLVYNREFANDNLEQDSRIQYFLESGYIKVLSPNELEGKSLRDKIIESLNGIEQPLPLKICIEGKSNTQKIIKTILSKE